MTLYHMVYNIRALLQYTSISACSWPLCYCHTSSRYVVKLIIHCCYSCFSQLSLKRKMYFVFIQVLHGLFLFKALLGQAKRGNLCSRARLTLLLRKVSAECSECSVRCLPSGCSEPDVCVSSNSGYAYSSPVVAPGNPMVLLCPFSWNLILCMYSLV